MRQIRLDRPLKNSEIEKLGDFLFAANNGSAMTIDELDGFFCALICGPELVPPSEYLPAIFRGRQDYGGVFESSKQAEWFLSVTMRLWNTIAATLLAGEPYKALIFDNDVDGVSSATRWAVGFEEGMSVRADSWKPLIDDSDASALLMPVLTLAGEDGPVPGTVPVQIPAGMEEVLLFGLMASIPAIYAYMRTDPKRRRTKTRKGAAKKSSKSPSASAAKRSRQRTLTFAGAAASASKLISHDQ